MVKVHKKIMLPKSVYVDACLQGMGGYFEGCVYFKAIPTEYCLVLSIVHLEMLNVLVAMNFGPGFGLTTTSKYSVTTSQLLRY